MSDGDSFTEVTRQGYFSRLGGSIGGIFIGLLLIPAAIVLLWWNEGRVVAALDALAAGAKQLVEISATVPDPSAEGKLVHLTGMLTVQAGAADPILGVSEANLIRLKRMVQMYQWKEEVHETTRTEVGGTKVTEKTYTYSKEWADRHIDSAGFKHPDGHRNPALPIADETFNGQEVKLGAYRVTPTILDEIDAFKPLSPTGAAPAGWRRDDRGFIKSASESDPAIGDVKVAFEGVEAQPYSVVAALSSGALAEYRGANDYRIALAKPGSVSAADLFKAKQAEEKLLTWILRLVGFVLMLLGFLLIASPAATLFAFLPLLGGIAEAGVFLIALTLSVPITFLVIALAWIAHRPFTGIALLVLGGAFLVLFRRMHPRRARA